MRRSVRVATAAIARASAASVRSPHAASSTAAKGARRVAKRTVVVAAATATPGATAPLCTRASAEHEPPGDENVESANATSIAIKHERDAIAHAESTLCVSSNAVKSENVSTAASAAPTDDADTKQCAWHRLCSTLELSCKLTLASGQTFAWHYDAQTCEWSGVVGHNVFALREHCEHVEFQCLHPLGLAFGQALATLTHYFRLETAAVPLYTAWTAPNDAMAQIMLRLRGHRLVRQDPVECLFAFICSSNNNIPRIQQLVDKLRMTYGTRLLLQSATGTAYYAFPSVETLQSQCDEATLRTLGFGYRAAFITKTSGQLAALGGAAYLEQIRAAAPLLKTPERGVGSEDDDPYQAQLMAFAGVGRKVADCVGLFALERLDAIPVDTHVWQIACREFDATLVDAKSLTPSVYQRVGDHFRARFAPYAGWAHSVLFTGDLSAFQSHLPAALQKTAKRNGTSASAAKAKRPKAAEAVTETRKASKRSASREARASRK